MLLKEITKIKGWTVEETCRRFLNEDVRKIIKEWVKTEWSIKETVKKPVASFDLRNVERMIVETIIPTFLHVAASKTGIYIDGLIKKLELADLVKKQVDSFSTSRLEEMVLGITKRELKMITYLGAYLGGVIGILQGLVVIFLNG